MQSIFVSSTFRDMMEERDMMQELVLPSLRAFSRDYGQSLNIVDLRWGVNTEDLDTVNGAKKVLSVCFDEIDRCRPFMVVFLGERYGWCPPTDLFRGTVPEGLQIEQGTSFSMTALEIEYGALIHGRNADKCLFYFRDPLPTENMDAVKRADYIEDDPAQAALMRALKQRIENSGARVRHYHADWDAQRGKVVLPDSLAEQIESDLKELLTPQYAQSLREDEQSRTEAVFWQTIEEKAAHFRARDTLAGEYIKEICRKSCSAFGLYGESGSGKSTMLSHIAVRLRAQAAVIPYICGSSSKASTADSIPRFILWKLLSLMGEETERLPSLDDAETKARLTEAALLWEKLGRGPVYVIIDGAELLDRPLDIIRWSGEQLPDCITTVYSWMLKPGETVQDSAAGRVNRMLPPLDRREQRLVIDGVTQYKQIYESVAERMMAKADCANPLFLSLLTQRLLWMDSEDFEASDQTERSAEQAILHRMMHVIDTQPSGLSAAGLAFLTEAAERVGVQSAKETFALMAVSRIGLRVEDLAGIHRNAQRPFSALAFSRLRKYMLDFFTERPDGRIDFTHRAFREGILQELEDKTVWHKSLFNWLRSLPGNDPVKQSEVLYHGWRCGNRNYLIRYFSRNCDSSAACSRVAEELMGICRIDDCRWLRDCLTDEAIDDNCLFAWMDTIPRLGGIPAALSARFWKTVSEFADRQRKKLYAENRALVWQWTARALVNAGDRTGARHAIAQADGIRLPNNDNTMRIRMNCALMEAQIDCAEQAYSAAEQCLTDFASAWREKKLPAAFYSELLSVLLKQDKTEDAEKAAATFAETATDTSLALRKTAEMYAENGFALPAAAQYERLIRHLRQSGGSEPSAQTELTQAFTEAFNLSYECGSWRDACRFGKELAPLLAAELEERPSTLVRRAYTDFCKKYEEVCLTRFRFGSCFRLMARERSVAKHLYARTGEEEYHRTFKRNSGILGCLLVILTLIVVIITLLMITRFPRGFTCLFLAILALGLGAIWAAGKTNQKRTQKEWRSKWNT